MSFIIGTLKMETSENNINNINRMTVDCEHGFGQGLGLGMILKFIGLGFTNWVFF